MHAAHTSIFHIRASPLPRIKSKRVSPHRGKHAHSRVCARVWLWPRSVGGQATTGHRVRLTIRRWSRGREERCKSDNTTSKYQQQQPEHKKSSGTHLLFCHRHRLEYRGLNLCLHHGLSLRIGGADEVRSAEGRERRGSACQRGIFEAKRKRSFLCFVTLAF